MLWPVPTQDATARNMVNEPDVWRVFPPNTRAAVIGGPGRGREIVFIRDFLANLALQLWYTAVDRR
jgi:hypothetical protein